VLEARVPVNVESTAVFSAVETSVKRVFERMGYRYERKKSVAHDKQATPREPELT
jgi:hypothetical protein